jgi:ribonuclease HI
MMWSTGGGGGGGFTHPTQVFTEAVKALDDFQRVNGSTNDEEGASQIHSDAVWKPPEQNWVKINWDAAVDQSNQCVGIGVVARDGTGRFLGASSWKISLSARPVVAEAMAAFQALLFASEHGYRHVCFEGDTLTIVNEVNSYSPCESSHGHFVEDIRDGLTFFEMSRFTHVKREANMAAHVLAKQVCKLAANSVRWHSIPSCISGIIRKEEFSPSL